MIFTVYVRHLRLAEPLPTTSCPLAGPRRHACGLARYTTDFFRVIIDSQRVDRFYVDIALVAFGGNCCICFYLAIWLPYVKRIDMEWSVCVSATAEKAPPCASERRKCSCLCLTPPPFRPPSAPLPPRRAPQPSLVSANAVCAPAPKGTARA